MTTPENAGDIANLGIIVGTRRRCRRSTPAAASASGKASVAAVRGITDKPIRYVINTHDHPDHVFGNAAYAGRRDVCRAPQSAEPNWPGAAHIICARIASSWVQRRSTGQDHCADTAGGHRNNAGPGWAASAAHRLVARRPYRLRPDGIG